MLKAVLDTVVFVRCLMRPMGIWGSLVVVPIDRYRLIVSESVVNEILEVLQRPEVKSKFHPFPAMHYERVLDVIGEAEVVSLPALPAASRDPKDDKFLATARAANADYLITEEEGLLVVSEYEGTRIVTARDFLDILERYEA